MDERSRRISVESAFALCEEYRAWWVGRGEAACPASEKCEVEFTL